MSTEIAKLTVALEAQTAKFSKDMDAVNRRMEGFAKRQEMAARRSGAAWSKFGGMLKMFAVAYLGTALFRGVLRATAQAEESFARLQIAVANNGKAATKTAEQYAAFATKLQGASTFSDEAIQDAISSLLKFKELSVTIEQATQLSIDLAARLKKDLPEAAKLVGKALSDPAHSLRTLEEAGVVLTEQQKKMIKWLVETGQTAKASAFIFDELSRSTVGAGAAMRDNFAGALEGLKNDLDNLLEAKSGLPALTTSINQFAEMARDPAVKAGIDSLLGTLVTLLGVALTLIGKVAAAIQALPSVSTFLPFGKQIEALAKRNAPQPVTDSGPHPRSGTGGAMTFDTTAASSEAALMAEFDASKGAKSHAKAIEQATEAINKQIEALQLQVLTFGASDAGAAALTATTGEMAKEFALMGPAGEVARVKYIELQIALQTLKEKQDAENEAVEATKKLHEEIADALQNTKTSYDLASESVDKYVGWLQQGLITQEQFYSLVKKVGEGIAEEAKKSTDAAEEMTIQWDQAMRNMQDILADTLFHSFENGTKDMVYQWALALKQMAANALAANIFGALTAGAKSSGGFLSGFLGALFGAFSPGGGGGSAGGGSGAFGGAGARAEGGPILPNKWYMVGEKGPELIRSAAHGMVLPASTSHEILQGDMHGSRGVNIVMNITTPDADSFMRTQQQIQARMSKALTRASARNN